MYLTKLMPIMGDDYLIHQEVKKLFEDTQKVLFQQTDSCLIVLSDLPCTKGKTVPVDFSSYALSEEQHLFSVRLNAASRSTKTGKRETVLPDKVEAWVASRLSKIGVEAVFQIKPEGIRKSLRKDKVISLSSIFVTGYMTVKEPDLFRKALESGIGHGKGFGYGLLNIFS